MNKKIFKVSLILLLAFGLTSASFAQGRQTGSISGTVVDTEGELLDGCIVTLSGPNLLGTKSYTTSEAGKFRFPALPPGGDYQLRAELTGFKTTIRGDLIVSVAKTTTVTIVLEVSAIEEEVTVTATAPIVDIETATVSVTYAADFLASLPMDRDLYGLQNSIPGAISEGVDYRRTSSILGGTVRSQLYQLDGVPMNDPATFYPMANINVDVYEEIEFGIGSLPAEVGQTDSVFVNIVTKSGGNKFSGSVSAYYTGDTLARNLLSNEDLEAIGVNPPEKFTDYKDVSLNFGGPVIKDRLWFFLNGRRLLWGRANPETHDIRLANIILREWTFTPEELQHYDFEHEEWLGFAKLTFQLTKKIRYMGMYHWNNIYEPVYSNRTGNDYTFALTIVWDHENTHTTTHQLNWVLNQNTFVDVRGTYVYRHFPILMRPEYSNNYMVYDQRYQVFWGNTYYGDDYLRKKALASVSLTHFADDLLGASHELKFGAEYEDTIYGLDRYKGVEYGDNPYYTYWRDYNAGDKYYYGSWRGRLRMRPFAERGVVWKYDNTRRFSAFAQDSIVSGRLAINVGLRFDYGYQYEPEQTRPAMYDRYKVGPEFLNSALEVLDPNILLKALNDQYHNDPNIEFNQISALDPMTTPYKKIVEYTTLSPRIGLVYDLFGNGKTALKASFSRYYEPIWSAKYNASNTMSGGAMNWYWYDLNRNGYMDLPIPSGAYGSPVDPQYLDPLGDQYRLTSYDVQDPDFMYYIKDLKAPYMHEFMGGIEHEVSKDFKLGLQFIYKVNKNIVDDVDKFNGYDPNATDDQGRPIWLPYDFVDPGWDGIWGTSDDQNMTAYGLADYAPTRAYRGVNPPEAKREYMALVLTFDKRMSNRWQMQGSILYSAFKGNCDPGYSDTEGESGMFDNPNVMINSYGRVAFDRPLQIKLIATVMLPLDISLTGYLQHRSGSAWRRTISRVYFPDDIPTQDSYASVAAETYGTRRNPPYTMLDMRVEKSFAFGDLGKLSLFIDAFNLGGRSGYSISQNPNPYIYPYEDPPRIVLDTDYGLVTSCYGVTSVRFGARFTF
ncbi:MAG: carboxypeptidase regulatory-like domain-containing protein [Candidatus Aminicenantes bacterium]|nr:carboxypeptidase regulatory-like domain-containing protein [Candidatus Aminicenantes bacterium]